MKEELKNIAAELSRIATVLEALYSLLDTTIGVTDNKRRFVRTLDIGEG